ncbi:MAG: translation initiation factor IF-2 [Kiritimatiellae bacterium]|nr:translation initiation factor IF-2 [Kiritimatiellia bacterium]
MRVCELAGRAQTSSYEVMKQAEALDIEVYSPLTKLEEGDVKKLQEALNKRSNIEIERGVAERAAQREKKLKAVVSRVLERTKIEGAALKVHRDKALEMDALLKGKVVPTQALPAQAAEEVQPEKIETPVVTAEAVAPVAAAVEPTAAAVEPVAEGVEPTAAAVAPAAETGSDVAPVAPVAKKKPKPAGAAAPAAKPPKKIDESTAEAVETRFERADKSVKATKPARAHDQRPGFKEGKADKESERHQREVVRPRGAPQRQVLRQREVTATAMDEKSVAPDRIITLRGAVVIKELAERMGLRPNRLIADLMQMNMLVSINERIELDIASRLTDKYGFKIEIERQKRSSERRPVLKTSGSDDAIPEDEISDMVVRPPVVTFLGHVDHGKTSLMDRIRNTKVASGEAGGITQHLGAYTLELSGRKITFLDTPGHAAFSSMRERGASMTDIAVIIIAADDGIMPQTREAIKHARAAGVQIMVAINKCDLPDAQPDKVRQMLQAEGLTPEEWGGDVICSEVSAATGAGMDHLLDMILLQADMLELMANPKRRADGIVVEAQLEQGLGPTATLLIKGGTLKVGDILLCGEYFGKSRGLIDDRGRRVKSAGPSTAVKCMGLSGVPEAGAEFRVMNNEKRTRALASEAANANKMAQLSASKPKSMDAMLLMSSGKKLELPVIVKADTQGSLEAIVEAFNEIKSEKVKLNVISDGIGNVSATDVNKAAAGSALVVGFSVGIESGVQQLARHDGVRINTFRIIYEMLDFIKERMLDLLPPEYKEVVRGHAEIRAIFDIGKTGRVAGCQMLNGTLLAKGYYRIKRGSEVVYEGTLAKLQHFQQVVSEVSGSQECGILFKGFEDFAVGDIVECYVQELLPVTL